MTEKNILVHTILSKDVPNKEIQFVLYRGNQFYWYPFEYASSILHFLLRTCIADSLNGASAI